MFGFQWRKRHGGVVDSSRTAVVFSSSSDDLTDHETDAEAEDHAQQNSAPSSSSDTVSSCLSESERREVRERGIQLAEMGRFWQALHVWRPLLSPTHSTTSLHDAQLWEMASQVQSELAEIYPALESACESCGAAPLWWQAHVTVSRALVNVGEPGLARRQCSVARHLRPDMVTSHELLELSQLVSRTQQRGCGCRSSSPSLASDQPDDEEFVGQDCVVCTDVAGIVSQEQSDFVRAMLRLHDVKISLKLASGVCRQATRDSSHNDPPSQQMQVD